MERIRGNSEKKRGREREGDAIFHVPFSEIRLCRSYHSNAIRNKTPFVETRFEWIDRFGNYPFQWNKLIRMTGKWREWIELRHSYSRSYTGLAFRWHCERRNRHAYRSTGCGLSIQDYLPSKCSINHLVRLIYWNPFNHFIKFIARRSRPSYFGKFLTSIQTDSDDLWQWARTDQLDDR